MSFTGEFVECGIWYYSDSEKDTRAYFMGAESTFKAVSTLITFLSFANVLCKLDYHATANAGYFIFSMHDKSLIGELTDSDSEIGWISYLGVFSGFEINFYSGLTLKINSSGFLYLQSQGINGCISRPCSDSLENFLERQSLSLLLDSSESDRTNLVVYDLRKWVLHTFLKDGYANFYKAYLFAELGVFIYDSIQKRPYARITNLGEFQLFIEGKFI